MFARWVGALNLSRPVRGKGNDMSHDTHVALPPVAVGGALGACTSLDSLSAFLLLSMPLMYARRVAGLTRLLPCPASSSSSASASLAVAGARGAGGGAGGGGDGGKRGEQKWGDGGKRGGQKWENIK